MALKNCVLSTHYWYRQPILAVMLVVAVALSGCISSSPPKRTDNVCKIFQQKSKWYKHTYRAVKKWRVDGAVLLAIMRQESGFNANAKPKRKRLFGIPLKRPSSAFGYPQALDGTWKLYRKSTNNFFAQRDSFADAIDFIGWYVAQSRKQLKISPRDGYRNYLAYHEGWNGYERATYKRKKWLLLVAKRIENQANQYREQLKSCRL